MEFWAIADKAALSRLIADNKIDFAMAKDPGGQPTGRATGCAIYPATWVAAGSRLADGMAHVHTFEASSAAEAADYFRGLLERGCPKDPRVVGNAGASANDGKTWHHRGFPHYVAAALRRFGLTRLIQKDVQDSPALKRIGCAVEQMCGRYHKSRKADGIAQLMPFEARQVAATLDDAESHCLRLHVQAAASASMLDEAWRYFGIEHIRPFAIVATPTPGPAADPTPEADPVVPPADAPTADSPSEQVPRPPQRKAR